MSTTVASLARLQQKAVQADQLISLLKSQISSLHQSAAAKACLVQQEKLQGENAALRREVALLKKSLQAAEMRNGVEQVSVPDKTSVTSVMSHGSNDVTSLKGVAAQGVTAQGVSAQGVAAQGVTAQCKETLATENVKRAAKSDKKVVAQLVEGSSDLAVAAKITPAAAHSPAKTKVDVTSAVAASNTAAAATPGATTTPVAPTTGANTTGATSAGGADGVDVSRLDMRIGFIESAKRHPDADSLYVEEVNVGEAKCRTIVSGLVKHISLDQMQKRYAVFLLNLKPARMRGITSEGMIMCASTPDKVEIIEPPAGVQPGDRVTCAEYPGNPDELLNPKRKIWEQVQPDLRINGEGFATYKAAVWRVEGKGPCKAPSMVNSPIK